MLPAGREGGRFTGKVARPRSCKGGGGGEGAGVALELTVKGETEVDEVVEEEAEEAEEGRDNTGKGKESEEEMIGAGIISIAIISVSPRHPPYVACRTCCPASSLIICSLTPLLLFSIPITRTLSYSQAKAPKVSKAFADLLVLGPAGDMAGGRARMEMEDDPKGPAASLGREGGRQEQKAEGGAGVGDMTREVADGDGGVKGKEARDRGRGEARDRGRGGRVGEREGAYLELADFEYVKVDLSLTVENL